MIEPTSALAIPPPGTPAGVGSLREKVEVERRHSGHEYLRQNPEEWHNGDQHREPG